MSPPLLTEDQILDGYAEGVKDGREMIKRMSAGELVVAERWKQSTRKQLAFLAALAEVYGFTTPDAFIVGKHPQHPWAMSSVDIGVLIFDFKRLAKSHRVYSAAGKLYQRYNAELLPEAWRRPHGFNSRSTRRPAATHPRA